MGLLTDLTTEAQASKPKKKSILSDLVEDTEQPPKPSALPKPKFPGGTPRDIRETTQKQTSFDQSVGMALRSLGTAKLTPPKPVDDTPLDFTMAGFKSSDRSVRDDYQSSAIAGGKVVAPDTDPYKEGQQEPLPQIGPAPERGFFELPYDPRRDPSIMAQGSIGERISGHIGIAVRTVAEPVILAATKWLNGRLFHAPELLHAAANKVLMDEFPNIPKDPDVEKSLFGAMAANQPKAVQLIGDITEFVGELKTAEKLLWGKAGIKIPLSRTLLDRIAQKAVAWGATGIPSGAVNAILEGKKPEEIARDVRDEMALRGIEGAIFGGVEWVASKSFRAFMAKYPNFGKGIRDRLKAAKTVDERVEVHRDAEAARLYREKHGEFPKWVLEKYGGVGIPEKAVKAPPPKVTAEFGEQLPVKGVKPPTIPPTATQIAPTPLPATTEAKVAPTTMQPPAVAETAAEGVEKQPWEMTKKEFIDSDYWKNKYKGLHRTGPDQLDYLKKTPKQLETDRKYVGEFSHETRVKDALEQGKPVPAEVLKDYPDLATEGVGEAGTKKPAAQPPAGPPVVEPLAKTEATPGEKAEATTELDTTRYPTKELPVSALTLSTDVPNFKEGADAKTGVVRGERLEGPYIRLGTGPIVVWERENGKMEVITGRHRLDLARQSGEQTVPTQVVSEKKGFTKGMALTLDAESNIRDGQGTTKDYASYFRNTEISEDQARKSGLLSRIKGQNGFRIGKSAGDDVYTTFINGKLSDAKAAAIVKGAPGNNNAQSAALAKAATLSAEELGQFTAILNRTEPDRKSLTQENLFGWDESALQEAEAVAKEVSKEQAAIKDRVLAVKGALRRPEMAAKMGLRFNNEQEVRDEVARLEERIDALNRVATNADLYREMRSRTQLGLFDPQFATEGEKKSPAGGKTIGAPREIDRQRITVSMEPGGKPMAAHTIIDYMRQAFKIPVRGTATFKKKALGWFDPHGVGIRLKDVVSLTTGMHEIGHHIDWEINKRWSKTPPPAIAKELLRLGHELYGDRKPPGGYKSEGWAEFIRELLTTENAQTKAPKLYDWFHKEYLPEHKDIAKHLKKLRKMIDRWRMQGAQSRIRSQRVKWDIKSSIGEVIDRFKLRVQADWLDEFASIRIGIEKAGIDPDSIRPDKNPIILAAVLGDKAGAKAHYFATEGTTNLAGKKTGKSLKEALKPVAGEIERFLDWAHAAKGLQLYKLGINPGISEADAQYIYDLRKSSVYEQALKDWTEWSRAGLDYMVEAGALPLRVANHIKAKHPIYIPMLRAFKKGEVRTTSGTGQGFTKAGKPVKKIKGSGRPIIDPITSSLQQMEKMISASHKVMVAKSIADLADKHGVAGLIWRVPPPQKATTFSAEQIKKDIVKIAQEKLGLDLDEGIPSGILEDWDDLLTVFTNAESYRGKDNIVMVEFDGKKHWFEVNPDLYAVLEGLDQYRLPWFLDVVFGKPTRMLRLGATGLNAAFGMIRNPLRDIATFTVLAKHAKTPVAAISGIGKDVITKASGIAENFGIKGIPKSRAADLFIAMGGEMSVQVLHDRRGAKYLRSEVLASSGTQYIIRTFLHPVDAMRNAVGITEAGTRIGEFGAALKYAEKKWGKDSKAASFYALYMGQDVTTPFTRHGGIGKKVNQTVAFFNAAVQGPAKIYRTFRDRPLRTSLMAISALTVPAVWLWWKNKDKEWFKNMSEYEKYGYQHFEVLGEDDVIVRWPVAFELGHIFQTLPVAYLDQMYQRKPAEVKKAFKFVLKMANPFDVPAAAGPIIDVISNEDFAGRPIVPERNRRKLPEDQVSPYTKPLMKTIGKALNMSPAVLEHLADSYSGGVYGRVARLLEFEEIQQPADVPVIGTLFMREPYAPRAQTEAFYDERGRLTAMYGSKEITPIDNRRRIMYDRAARALTPIWKQLRNTKDKDERKKLYDEISQIVNSVNKEGQKKGRKELPSVKLDDLLDKALRDI